VIGLFEERPRSVQDRLPNALPGFDALCVMESLLCQPSSLMLIRAVDIFDGNDALLTSVMRRAHEVDPEEAFARTRQLVDALRRNDYAASFSPKHLEDYAKLVGKIDATNTALAKQRSPFPAVSHDSSIKHAKLAMPPVDVRDPKNVSLVAHPSTPGESLSLLGALLEIDPSEIPHERPHNHLDKIEALHRFAEQWIRTNAQYRSAAHMVQKLCEEYERGALNDQSFLRRIHEWTAHLFNGGDKETPGRIHEIISSFVHHYNKN
jgi:hypothetical protein